MPEMNFPIFRSLSALVALAITVFVSACASSGPKVDPQITSALSQKGVTGSTYQKVSNAQKLGYNDILQLVQAGVPAHYIESYLQSTQSVYRFTPAQISTLSRAGAPSQLTHYLEETPGFYVPPQTASSAGRGPNWERTNSPLYQDEQPFAYNAPAVDYWYNSA